MIVLDTNVISELTKNQPAPIVLAWFDRQRDAELCIASVTEAELWAGSEILPRGRRRSELEEANVRIINEVVGGRVLPFNRAAARMYAVILAHRNAIGRPINKSDCMIAAIARVNDATVATRDIGGFQHCGIEVVNPWGSP